MRSKVKIGVIRVVTTDDWDFLREHARIISEYISNPELEIITDRIDGFPNGIPNEKEEKRAIPFVIETAQRMIQNHDIGALFISCAADPAVKDLQNQLQIPVIGAGATSAYCAKSLGLPVGVLGIDDRIPKVVADALGENLKNYRTPINVATTMDIDESHAAFIDLAKELVQSDGARVILLACTGLSTARIAPEIRNQLKIPVIDPVISSGMVAYYIARGNLSQNGE